MNFAVSLELRDVQATCGDWKHGSLGVSLLHHTEMVLSRCVMEQGEHPVPRAVSQAMGWKKVKRSSRDGAPGEQRENLGQQQRPAVRKEMRDARWQRGFGRKCCREGCRVRSLGSSRGSVGHWRETSKVAPSPLLVSFSPGLVECISAQIFLEVRAALLASACDLQLAGKCGCKCRIPDEHRACRWLGSRYQKPLPQGSTQSPWPLCPSQHKGKAKL